jgi:hypothetical protein
MGVRERLRVPTSWWLLAGLGVLILFVAYDVALGRAPALITSALLVLATTVWLLAQGSTLVAAGPDGLQAGAAHLPGPAIGSVEVLDQQAMAAARGAEADPRAFYLIKGYVRTGVRVWVDDPNDPVPYWVVSSRHPQQLAAEAAAARDAARPRR